jgi:hypothetical protein
LFVIIVPPVAKPSEPLIGAYSLARLLRQQGTECTVIDSNLAWLYHQIWGRNLHEIAERRPSTPGAAIDNRVHRAIGHLQNSNPLLEAGTYQVRDRYAQAVEHLSVALGLSDAMHPDEEPGLADFRVRDSRPVVRKDLDAYAGRTQTVFDGYVARELLPQISSLQPQVVGFSLTFLHQVYAAVRFASMIRIHHPGIRLILGGALVDCWQGAEWRDPPFNVFDAVISSRGLLRQTGNNVSGLPVNLARDQGFFVDPVDLPGQRFFAPQNIFPMAFGLGCAWGRCTFCPDYLSHPYQPPVGSNWLRHLEALAVDHGPFVLHLTDSCAPPNYLDQLAHAIRERNWPIRWYAFVRLSRALLESGRLELWAKGGCSMLQFGLETAAEGLLKRMRKGITITCAADILKKSAAVGIRNYVYLLFGFPGETELEQLETMEFVVQHQDSIHFLNNAIFNLPRHSPIAADPQGFDIQQLHPFPGEDTDLSLYLDFLDAWGSARRRARRFLHKTFLSEAAIRRRVQALPPVFKSNHAIFAGWPA